MMDLSSLIIETYKKNNNLIETIRKLNISGLTVQKELIRNKIIDGKKRIVFENNSVSKNDIAEDYFSSLVDLEMIDSENKSFMKLFEYEGLKIKVRFSSFSKAENYNWYFMNTSKADLQVIFLEKYKNAPIEKSYLLLFPTKNFKRSFIRIENCTSELFWYQTSEDNLINDLDRYVELRKEGIL